MKAREFVVEIADSSYKITFTREKPRAVTHFFELDDENRTDYVVQSEVDSDNTLHLNFASRASAASNVWDQEQSHAAGGKAIKIFATVLRCLVGALNHFQKSGVDVEFIKIRANSKEETRRSLYGRFAKNPGRYLPGWQYHSEQTISHPEEGYPIDEYTLTKVPT